MKSEMVKILTSSGIRSGTSMAAPHACGVLLLTNGNPKSDGTVSGDPDGNPDPIIHK
jgi:hypothetical protein